MRRELARRTNVSDPEEIRADGEARRLLEELHEPKPSADLADRLLAWVDRRTATEGPGPT